MPGFVVWVGMAAWRPSRMLWYNGLSRISNAGDHSVLHPSCFIIFYHLLHSIVYILVLILDPAVVGFFINAILAKLLLEFQKIFD